MAVQKINIEQFLELAKQHPVIDVRSPGEYNHAHLSGAHSLPLFTDEERKVVGTTYKQKSREEAIKIGLDFFGPKMKAIVEEAEQIIDNWQLTIDNKQLTTSNENQLLNSERNSKVRNDLPIARCLLLYCWRGGMRSAAIAWLLDLYGFKIYTLVGGYKRYRNYVLDTFKLPFQLKILGGYTGSGKTELLKTLNERGEKIVDLEDLAKHKGSAFGSIGMPAQPSQEMFENLLATELRRSMVNSSTTAQTEISMKNDPDSPFTPDSFRDHHSPIWLEDESQRIGHVNIPNDLWKTMRRSPVYFLDIPFEERLRHITEEYGSLEVQKVTDAIQRISEKLGGLNTKLAIQWLESGNTLESFRILLEYYDKFYSRSLHNREDVNSLLQSIECKSVSAENANLLIRHVQYQTN